MVHGTKAFLAQKFHGEILRHSMNIQWLYKPQFLFLQFRIVELLACIMADKLYYG